jgi:hypothetical protein
MNARKATRTGAARLRALLAHGGSRALSDKPRLWLCATTWGVVELSIASLGPGWPRPGVVSPIVCGNERVEIVLSLSDICKLERGERVHDLSSR